MDEQIMWAVNGLIGRSSIVDNFLVFFVGNPVFKGVPLALLFLYLWFKESPEFESRRPHLLAMLLVSILAIAIGIIMAVTLPFRLRPLHSGLDFRLPFEEWHRVLDGWSSMPSDHAVLFFAFTTGFWIIDRRVGLISMLYSIFAIIFIRVYFLVHWPSDVVVGALIGVVVMLFLLKPVAMLVRRTSLVELSERHPELMQPVLFFLLFQFATTFASLRAILNGLYRLLT